MKRGIKNKFVIGLDGNYTTVCVCAYYHISAKTEAERPDWRKNFLACSPTNEKRRTSTTMHFSNK